MLQLVARTTRARLTPLSLAPLAPVLRGIHIKAPGYGSPEAEGPLYTHSAAVVHGIHSPEPNAQKEPTKPPKKRDPKSKNHKVTGGSNFQELRKLHDEGRD